MRAHAIRATYAMLLALAAVLCAAVATEAAPRTPPDRAKEQELQVTLRGGTIVNPALTKVEGDEEKRVLLVDSGVKIKLTVKSEDKTYRFAIDGKSGAECTVDKGKVSSPIYLTLTSSGEEHEIIIEEGGAKVSAKLFLRAR
jgi:hypothetical protein